MQSNEYTIIISSKEKMSSRFRRSQHQRKKSLTSQKALFNQRHSSLSHQGSQCPKQTSQQSSISEEDSYLECQAYSRNSQEHFSLENMPPIPQQSLSDSYHLHHFKISPDKRGSSLRERGVRRKKCRSHNLKTIACHLIRLIENNNLTVRQLGCLLFEIMGQTNFGCRIVAKGYQQIENNQLSEICVKYKEQKEESPSMRMVIRNVRRRLYDALNVMLASHVIYKRFNSTFHVKDYKDEPTVDHLQEEQYPNNQIFQLLELKEQINNREKRIKKKKSLISELKEKVCFLSKFIDRNSHETNQIAFYLPILVVHSSSKFICELETNRLECKGESFIMLSDLEIVKLVVNNEEKRRPN